ncbi:MAG: FG-GAP-like repeat-containing protein [Bacteroidota bacterium]
MRKFLLHLFVVLPVLLAAQIQQAFLLEDGTIQVEETTLPSTVASRSTFEQLEGFPKAFPANSTFKNFRNLTLVDLDGDGGDEIIFGANNRLYAYTSKGLLWEKEVIGTAIYPPTVADLDGDGQFEILLATGGVPNPGRLYLVDEMGEDLKGWPLNFDDNWVLSAPVVSDVDGDGILEIVAASREAPTGKVHLLTIEGKSYSENWPQTLDRTPAVTPSIGDVNGDGEKEIVIFSTASQYVFDLDGNVLEGYPVAVEGLKHSYQSPILTDLDDDNRLDIIAAGHGDAPEYFARNFEGNYLEGWPRPVPFDSWTFSSPSLLNVEGQKQIFMSRPIGGDENEDMLYSWNEQADLQADFPIVKNGGLEGIISIADVDGDEEPELIFGSNLYDSNTGTSFLHAYELDGGGQVAGFPIRPRGWAFMNGAAIGDVNGDNLMDAVLLTYSQNFGAMPDSIFVSAYNLEVPYSADRVWWDTYKGSNSRDGVFEEVISSVATSTTENSFHIFPNPTQDVIHWTKMESDTQLEIIDALGRTRGILDIENQQANLSHLAKGLYFLVAKREGERLGVQKLILID